MNKKYLSLLAVLLLLAAFRGYAAPGPYASIGGGLLTFDDGFDSVKPKQLIFRLGYDINQYVGVGFEGGFSLIEDELSGIDYSVTTTFIYLKGSIPVGDKSSIYVLAGPTNVELTGSFGGVSASADDDDTGLGFGFETQLTSARFFADYVTYFDDNDVDVTSINIGAAFSF